MLVRFFRNTYPSNIAVLLVLATIFQLPCFLSPSFITSDTVTPIVELISALADISPIISTILLFGCFLICILTVSKINKDNILISKTSLVPPAVFAVLMGFTTNNPIIIADMLILFSIQKLLDIDTANSDVEVDFLGAGFLTSLALLTDFNAMMFLLLLVLSIFITRSFRIRYIIIMILGFILPILIWIFFLYVRNDLSSALSLVTAMNFDFGYFYTNLSVTQIIFVCMIAVIAIVSVLYTLLRLGKFNISMRSKYTFLVITTVISVILAISTDSPLTYIYLSMPALSFLLAYMLTNIRNIWAEIIYTLVALVPLLLIF
ncbi:MAG: hypothetical protein PHR20_07640 [Bacteroidales bacterium]|nr:hypothetical protein [Bacteroidales bacterium]